MVYVHDSRCWSTTQHSTHKPFHCAMHLPNAANVPTPNAQDHMGQHLTEFDVDLRYTQGVLGVVSAFGMRIDEEER
jgi:hypothetical protein